MHGRDFVKWDIQKKVPYSGEDIIVPKEVLDTPGTLWITAIGEKEGVFRPTVLMDEPLSIIQNGNLGTT